MLIRFHVENFLSFNELTEFSMVAGQGTSLPHHVVKSNKRGIPNLLRAALIYGPNGSGKSNFVKAIDFAQKIILTDVAKDEIIAVKPFRLEMGKLHQPSKFQFDIKIGEQLYSYGFEVDSHTVKEEYLYLLGEKKNKIIFHRLTTSEGKTQVDFDNINFANNEEEQFLKFTGKGCPINKLFLTECNNRNVWGNVQNIVVIRNVWEWFANCLRIMTPDFYFTIQNAETNDYANLLKHFSTDIAHIDYALLAVENALDEIEVSRKWGIESMKDGQTCYIKSKDRNHFFFFEKDNGKLIASKLISKHLQNNTTIFEFAEESDGTKRLFDFLPVISFKNNFTFIIDEIDRSLHPHLSRAILEYFLENQVDINKQFIATTHEANLLDLSLLRKDEIWFSEKNKSGATELYSLEEFKPRPDTEIRSGYLQGRYGAIPFIGNVSALNG